MQSVADFAFSATFGPFHVNVSANLLAVERHNPTTCEVALTRLDLGKEEIAQLHLERARAGLGIALSAPFAINQHARTSESRSSPVIARRRFSKSCKLTATWPRRRPSTAWAIRSCLASRGRWYVETMGSGLQPGRSGTAIRLRLWRRSVTVRRGPHRQGDVGLDDSIVISTPSSRSGNRTKRRVEPAQCAAEYGAS